jgi:acetyl esterase/lipase
LSASERLAFERARDRAQAAQAESPAFPSDYFDLDAINAYREWYLDERFPLQLARYREKYDVIITRDRIAGVPVDTVVPRAGPRACNRERILVNLHGGGFVFGSQTSSILESIPVAAIGGFKVVSVDYRLAPGHSFPSAVEDVLAVYDALLKSYQPEEVGIYGCSAGALLTAQAVARLVKTHLPRPGAIAMLSAGASYWAEGDSAHFGAATTGEAMMSPGDHPYFAGVDLGDPLAFPLRSEEVMAQFPPSLLITSTRDFAMSSVVHTHSILIRTGVKADLRVWEGLAHAFQYDENLPQSREVHNAVAGFFDVNLGPSRVFGTLGSAYE